jgi:hypothetical protein
MLIQAIRGHQENIKIRDGVAHESL